MSGSKKHGSKHHIVPTSRGGQSTPENIMDLEPGFHDAWHTLFGNLLVEEVTALVKHCWATKSGMIDKRYLHGQKRQKAWKAIFQSTTITANEAVEIIKKKFIKRA